MISIRERRYLASVRRVSLGPYARVSGGQRGTASAERNESRLRCRPGAGPLLLVHCDSVAPARRGCCFCLDAALLPAAIRPRLALALFVRERAKRDARSSWDTETERCPSVRSLAIACDRD